MPGKHWLIEYEAIPECSCGYRGWLGDHPFEKMADGRIDKSRMMQPSFPRPHLGVSLVPEIERVARAIARGTHIRLMPSATIQKLDNLVDLTWRGFLNDAEIVLNEIRHPRTSPEHDKE